MDAFRTGRVIGRPNRWPPEDSWRRRLYWLVTRRFPKARQRLVIYDTVGTALDLYWGIDLVFWLEGSVATVDLSCREGKFVKADFLLTPEVLYHPLRLRMLTEDIARRLDRRIQVVRPPS